MNCTIPQQQIEDYADKLLTQKENMLFSSHLSDCETCQQSLVEHQAYLAKIRQLQAPQAAPEMVTRLIGFPRERNKQSPNSFWQGFVAASILAVMVIGSYLVVESDPVHTSMMVSIGSNIQAVDIAINAPSDMSEVTLSISLPDQLEVEGYGDTRQLIWTVDLIEGANQLTLPIRFIAGQTLSKPTVINVVMLHEEKERDFQIEVNFDPAQVIEQGATTPIHAMPELLGTNRYLQISYI
ncbi:MAG: hypothetical protein COB04_12645 [Gammaproteobacteria bacterium]|nr:MAG: hypothetical protein COB04_12645 [Gammaproteobacteria bacterium]